MSPSAPLYEEPPSEVDVFVVGAGLTGAATTWAATRRGLSVVVAEQFAVNHARGSSHGSARIYRRAYPQSHYVRLTGRANELWRELQHTSGRELLRPVGGLDHGARRDVARIAETLGEQGVEHELLSGAEAARRWPGMRFAGPVLFHPDAGVVDAERAVTAFLDGALGCGSVIFPHTRVHSVRVEGDAAIVETGRGPVRARRVVLAAGPWLSPLLKRVDGARVDLPPLVVTQQQVFHFPRLDRSERTARPERPWPVTVHKDVLSTYHLPGGRDGGPDDARKVAEHHGSTASTTAAERTGRVDAAGRQRIVDYVRSWLPGLSPEPVSQTTCLYTSTPSEDFVLDRVGPIVVASPCSGHGAKFAPVLGEMLADLVVGDTAPDPRFTLAAHLATVA